MSQVGHSSNGGFLNRPREDDDVDGLSMSAGLLSPSMGLRLMSKQAEVEAGEHGIRCTTVSTLREAGFQVTSDPYPANPLHVLVTCVGSWNDEALHNCFTREDWWHD